jgi:hypothetical protein
MHHLTALRKTRRLVFTTLCPLTITEVGPTGCTVSTMATKDRQAGDHVVTWFYIPHLGAHRFHHTGGFMPEHDRHRGWIEAFIEVHVAVTDASGDGADEHLVRTGSTDVDVFNTEWLANPP